MMQKATVFSLAFGAVIITAALIYHARQLARLSHQLEVLQKQNTALDNRLERFSTDLPHLIEQGGRNAGRQAVHGVLEGVVEEPLRWVNPRLVQGTSNVFRQIASSAGAAVGTTNTGEPLIRFDISQPVVNIRLFPNLKTLPDFPWLASGSNAQPTLQSNGPPDMTTEPADPK